MVKISASGYFVGKKFTTWRKIIPRKHTAFIMPVTGYHLNCTRIIPLKSLNIELL